MTRRIIGAGAVAVLALAACGTAGPPQDPLDPTTAAAVTEFYAEDGLRIAAFDVATGERLRYLTHEITGGSLMPRRVGDDGILFVHGGGTCSASLASVDRQGGEWSGFETSQRGAAVEPVSSAGGLAYISIWACGGPDVYEVRVRSSGTDDERVLAQVSGVEPTISDLASGSRFVSYLIGPTATRELYVDDPTGELEHIVVPPIAGCTWQTATWRTSETTSPTLLTAQTCADGTRLVEYDEDGHHPATLLELDRVVGSMDFDATGRELLLETHPVGDESHPEVWRWDGRHEPTKVAEGLTSPTW